MGNTATTGGIEAWRRHALFGISISMLIAGLVLGMQGSQGSAGFAQGICLKVGMVLFMLWLALPQLEKMNFWMLAPVGVTALIAIVRPQMLLILARVIVPLTPVLFLIWMFWKPKK